MTQQPNMAGGELDADAPERLTNLDLDEHYRPRPRRPAADREASARKAPLKAAPAGVRRINPSPAQLAADAIIAGYEASREEES